MAEARVRPRREPVFADRFGIFAECLLTGVWIAVASLGVVTYPAAFAAGARHLRRRAAHRGGGWREFTADFRSALRGDGRSASPGGAPRCSPGRTSRPCGPGCPAGRWPGPWDC